MRSPALAIAPPGQRSRLGSVQSARRAARVAHRRPTDSAPFVPVPDQNTAAHTSIRSRMSSTARAATSGSASVLEPGAMSARRVVTGGACGSLPALCLCGGQGLQPALVNELGLLEQVYP